MEPQDNSLVTQANMTSTQPNAFPTQASLLQTQNTSLQTQNTQNAQIGGTFVNWCTMFLTEFEKHKKVLSSSGALDPRATKFKAGAETFFQQSLANNGRRYAAIFRHLAVHCCVDQGLLASQSINAFISLVETFKLDFTHILYILRNMPTILESRLLSREIGSKMVCLFQMQMKLIQPSWVKEIHKYLLDEIMAERFCSTRCVEVATWISGLPAMRANWSIHHFLAYLLQKCNHKVTPAVIEVAQGFQCDVFTGFAFEVIRKDNKVTEDQEVKNFIKVMAILPRLTVFLVFKVLHKYIDEWFDKTWDFFKKIEPGIMEFAKVVSTCPPIANTTLQFFQKNGKYMRVSSFGMLVEIIVFNGTRCSEALSTLASKSMTKIMSINDLMKKDTWCRAKIKGVQLDEIVKNLTEILRFAKSSFNVGAIVNPGCVNLGLLLIETGNKTASSKIIEGRLETSTNTLSGIGRWLLISTIQYCHESEFKEYMRRLISTLCSTTYQNVAYSLIDIIVELRSKVLTNMVMNWDVFENFAMNITQLNPKVAVKAMASLMPVINQRSGLRSHLFNTLKTHISNPEDAQIVIPVLMQLLRSLVDQPEIRCAIESSQSFATFSSQIGVQNAKRFRGGDDTVQIMECIKKCLSNSAKNRCSVYTGFIEICKKNSHFHMQTLEFLYQELVNTFELSATNYFKIADDAVCNTIPLPHLFKALSSLLTIIDAQEKENPNQPLSELQVKSAAFVMRTKSFFAGFIHFFVRIDLEDLKLDSANMWLNLNTLDGDVHRSWGYFVLELYDVVMEHHWNSANNLDECVIETIVETLKRRNTLQTLMQSFKRKTTGYSLGLNDLQIDVPRLTSMLESLQPGPDQEANFYHSNTYILFPWLVDRIFSTVNKLSDDAVSGMASMQSLTSMATALFKYFLNSKDTADGLTEQNLAVLRKAKTSALEAFQLVVTYLVNRYGGSCHDALTHILLVVNINPLPGFTDTYGTADAPILPFVTPLPVENATPDEVASLTNEIICTKSINAYMKDIIPGIITIRQTFEANNALTDYSKQICILLKLCLTLFQKVVFTDNARMAVFNSLSTLGKTYNFQDTTIETMYASFMVEVFVVSNYSTFWIENLLTLSLDTTGILDPLENSERVYACINKDNVEPFYCMVGTIYAKLFEKVQNVLKIQQSLHGSIPKNLHSDVFNLMKDLIHYFRALLEMKHRIIMDSEMIWTNLGAAVTSLYSTVHMIFAELEKAEKHDRILSWSFINVLQEIVVGDLDAIVSHTCRLIVLGARDYKDLMNKPKGPKLVVQKVARDNKVLNAVNKETAKMYNRLLLLQDKTGFCRDIDVFKAAGTKRMRDFRVESAAVKQSLAGNSSAI